jgi:hypothetical protein
LSRLNDFIVNITLAKLPDKSAPFGKILIVTDDVDQAYKEYANLTAVLVDFADTTDTYKMAAQLFAQEPAPDGIAVLGDSTALPADITALLTANINQDFTVFYCTNASDTFIPALSAWAEANGRFYAATTQNKAMVKSGIRHAFVGYHSVAGDYMIEKLVTYMLVRPIGSVTGKFKTLVNTAESVVTDAELATLHSNYLGTYIKDMGVLQTTQAQTQSGEYVDVVLGALWLKLEMEAGLRNLALTTGKIPYTNAGIALLVGVAEKVLKEAAVNGIVLLDDSGNAVYTIDYLKREQTTAQDRAGRVYNSISWTASLAGAVEKAQISGTLEV